MGGMFVGSGQVESSGSGTIAALNGAVTVTIPTSSSFAFTLSGTWAATLVFEASTDGTTFFAIPAYTPIGLLTTSTTSNTSLVIPVGGYMAVRVRASLYTSGTATVTWNVDSNQNVITAASVLSDGTDIALVTANGDQKVSDGIRGGGVYGALSIPTQNTPVEAKVGGARLSGRKLLYIYSNNNGLFWGLDNTVTTSSGIPLVSGQVVTFAIDPDASTFQVWLVGSTNGKSVQVVEVP